MSEDFPLREKRTKKTPFRFFNTNALRRRAKEEEEGKGEGRGDQRRDDVRGNGARKAWTEQVVDRVGVAS